MRIYFLNGAGTDINPERMKQREERVTLQHHPSKLLPFALNFTPTNKKVASRPQK